MCSTQQLALSDSVTAREQIIGARCMIEGFSDTGLELETRLEQCKNFTLFHYCIHLKIFGTIFKNIWRSWFWCELIIEIWVVMKLFKKRNTPPPFCYRSNRYLNIRTSCCIIYRWLGFVSDVFLHSVNVDWRRHHPTSWCLYTIYYSIIIRLSDCRTWAAFVLTESIIDAFHQIRLLRRPHWPIWSLILSA